LLAVLGFSEFCDLGRLRREKDYVIEEKVIVLLNSNMNVQVCVRLLEAQVK